MSDHDVSETFGDPLSDGELMALVSEAVAVDDEPPPWAREAAQQALTWRLVDAELAELLDGGDRVEAVVRHAGGARTLTFGAAGLVVTVELDETGALDGHVEPAEGATVRLEEPGGTGVAVAVDEYGVFASPVPGRPFRLVVGLDGGPTVVTPWIL